MKHSELKQIIKEEIRSVLNEGLFDRFQKSDNKFEQAKKEIDQTDFNNFFIQPASFRIDDKERSMIISQLKKRVAERLPTLISLFPDLVSGNTLYNLKSNINGELIYGVTLGNLGGYITNDNLIIDNDVAKTKLKKNLKLNEGLFSRKKEIKSFQDYNDYIKGIDTTITVYQKGDKFLVTRRGHEEYVIKTFDNVEEALKFASNMANEDKFRTEPEYLTSLTEDKLNEINIDEIPEQDIVITIKKLLKSKEYLPSSYHEKIDDMVRKLYNKLK